MDGENQKNGDELELAMSNSSSDDKGDSKNKHHTLASFIEDNHKLLTTLGVFTALTVFASNIDPKPVGNILSIFFLTLTVLIWLEVWERFPPRNGSWRLLWFESVLSFSVLAILGIWLFYLSSVSMFLTLFMFLIISSFITWIMNRFDLFNRLFQTEPGKRKYLRYTLGLVLLIAMFFISYYLAKIASPPVQQFFDYLREEY